MRRKMIISPSCILSYFKQNVHWLEIPFQSVKYLLRFKDCVQHETTYLLEVWWPYFLQLKIRAHGVTMGQGIWNQYYPGKRGLQDRPSDRTCKRNIAPQIYNCIGNTSPTHIHLLGHWVGSYWTPSIGGTLLASKMARMKTTGSHLKCPLKQGRPLWGSSSVSTWWG